MSAFPHNNRTWQVIDHARQHNYAVGGFCVYNTDGVMAVIKAAEYKRSPAIIQLFPWTLHFQGPHFVRYVVEAAHEASVPISVQLDHCIQSSDIELALGLPFDSIMIDGPGSSGDLEASIASCSQIVKRGEEVGILIEAELGRVDGIEDGVDVEHAVAGSLTDPENAKNFVQATGVKLLAPSFGNVHGSYGAGGAEKVLQFDRLENIRSVVGESASLVLHGTSGIPLELVSRIIKYGVRKVNINKGVRQKYGQFISENAGNMELTKLKQAAVDLYAHEVGEFMDFLGSSNRA
ncbi:fructose-bisphosphate aldolase [Periconia macrospinosa]|uniref:Fructose-bisphosphate aldolase n=1 Tax=Periconia macrospinosa TaxID=97972 RepID=A0A2V1D773_9PLEO|nr:fructose-bisphosphate aldolase [Periconia macrospinosa]